MTASIASIQTRRLRVPLERPWGPDVRDLSFIEVTVSDSDGVVGYGFSWTPTIGAGAVEALLREDITAFALGRDIDPIALWPELWAHLHEAGGGGITTIALAGLDTALWDLAARRADQSLPDLLGRRRESVEVYGSGINLHYSLEGLQAQAHRWVDAGFDAVKMKVGSPDVTRDVERVRAVREIIGEDRRLMLDANQRWDLDAATAALEKLEQFDPTWIEEPLRADDLLAHRELRERTGVLIALGENIHNAYRFADFLDAGIAEVIQPNIIRVGGITPFREIVVNAEGMGAVVAPHLLPDLSGQLAMWMPSAPLVEKVEDAAFADLGILDGPAPIEISRNRLHTTGQPGLGIRFA